MIELAPVTGEVIDPLTEEERARKRVLEAVILKGRKAFLDQGRALREICESRLYREEYGTFEEYVKAVWDMGKSKAYYLTEAAGIADLVSTFVDTKPSSTVPTSEGQIRALAVLREQPDLLREAWRRAVAMPTMLKGRPTGANVRQAVADVMAEIGLPPPKARSNDSRPLLTSDDELVEQIIGRLEWCTQNDQWGVLPRVRQWIDVQLSRHPA